LNKRVPGLNKRPDRAPPIRVKLESIGFPTFAYKNFRFINAAAKETDDRFVTDDACPKHPSGRFRRGRERLRCSRERTMLLPREPSIHPAVPAHPGYLDARPILRDRSPVVALSDGWGHLKQFVRMTGLGAPR